MAFNQNKFISPLFKLFGKRLANVPPSPSNLDIIQFNGATQEWELVNGVIGNAVQSSSNVGAGEGVALTRVGDDLPFRSLVQNAEILLSGSATEIAFSVGIIAQSKITNLVSDLLLKEDKSNKGIAGGYAGLDGTALLFLANIPFLPISQITGLQTALDSKIETITNVGAFNEIAKAKVGTNVDLRTLQAGTNITIVQNANDLEISSTDTGEANTASNVGTGVNVFLQKIGVNLEFRTLLANAEVLITQNALDLAFSIGAIAQSKITGLITALGTKFDTVVNVGTGVGQVFRNAVGTTINLKTLLAGTNITIVNNADDITISSTDTGEANTASNVGAGVNVFLQKVGVNLEFRTLLANAEILITQNAQSKITGLVADLASKIETITNIGTGSNIAKAKVGTNVDLRSLLGNLEIIITENLNDLAFTIGVIAQSKITGLVTALGTKFDTVVNVGAGAGQVFRNAVGTTINLKTLLAGTGINIVNNADDITISATGGGASVVAIVGNNLDEQDMVDGEFFPCIGSDRQENDETRAQVVIAQALTLRRLAIVISANGRTSVTNFNLRVNGVTVNQTIAIPATTTGTFQDVTNTDVISNLDLINYLNDFGAGGGVITINSSCMESIA